MTLSAAGGTCAATMRWSLAMLLTCLLIVYSGAASSVRAQSDPRAAANQDVTPLQRCVGLAARTLDAPHRTLHAIKGAIPFKAMRQFARAYADQIEADHQALVPAVARGRLPAARRAD